MRHWPATTCPRSCSRPPGWERNDALAGYRHLATHRARYLGPAFGTKYLYFATPETGNSPLILDRLVARWVARHAGIVLNPVPWSSRTYNRYLSLMAAWSSDLEVIPAKVEELIFRDSAGGQWTDPIPSAVK
ncbi:hypothetical protein GCM10027053_26220 [Intrasporangium mesophilum]